MKPRRVTVLLVVLISAVAVATADNQQARPSAPPPHISRQTRDDLIRNFMAELVYIRTPFPMGKKGLTLKNGGLSPNGQELKQMMAMWGPAVKPGDQARISDIIIKNDRIHFEINGGPVKKLKWYQRIVVGGAGGSTPIAPSDPNANPRGSYVDLVFDRYVPELSPQELKSLLRPVFDFDSKSPVEAYLESVPPKIKEAIKTHNVLVGMNREMVIYAKGRPPRKIREKDGDTDYEEWIYGEPPHDVDFVRFIGDEVIRVETMKVGGEKMVRTEKEVDLDTETRPSVAQKKPEEHPVNAPTLRRPGEDLPNDPPKTAPTTRPPPTIDAPNSGPLPTTPDPNPDPHYVAGLGPTRML